MRTGTRTVGLAVICAALVISTAACATSGTQAPKGTDKRSVAFVVPNTSLNFAMEIAAGFGTGVRRVGGVDFSVVGTPRNDDAGEAALFKKLITSGKADDGIALFQQASDLFAPVIAEANAKKIPMIAVDNQTDETAKINLYVGNDNYALGQQLADEVIKRLPANAPGHVVVGTPVPGVPVLDLRAQGIIDEFHKRLPRIQVLGPFDTKQDPLVNGATWRTLIRANPTALAYLGTADQDSVNLATIREQDKATWLAGAFDLDPRALEAVKSGDLLLVSPEHYLEGAIAGYWQAQHAKDGRPLPKGWFYVPGLAITPANVDEIMKRQQSDTAKAAWFQPQIDKVLNAPKAYLRPLTDAR